MTNLSTSQLLTHFQLKLVPDDADSALLIPERNQLGVTIPAILAWTEFDSEFKERTAYACVIEEPEERAIALSDATTQHSGMFTEDGYPMAKQPYNEETREALRRAAQAVLLLG